MADLLLIAVAAATVNNFVVLRLLGLGPLLDGGMRLDDVPGLALVATAALILASGLCHLLERWVLAPYDLPYLRIVGYLALTALSVQLAVQLTTRLLRRRLDRPPVVTIIGLVLGVALLTAGTTGTLWGAVALGLGAGVGFGMVVLAFAGLRPRLERSSVPRSLRGPAISLITLGIVSLAFLGFSGVEA